MKIACVLLAALALSQAQAVHRDPQGRFRFEFPPRYGATSPGTNDGFGDRAAAVRFGAFPARLGGEAVLTRGFPLVDIQAVGGLYDSISLEILPDPVRARVVAQLTRLTGQNFCDLLGRPSHLDPASASLASLTPRQSDVIRRIDAMRNVTPRVVRCEPTGDVITFDKEASFDAAGPRMHIFGAIRFLAGDYSSFQLVAAGSEAPPALIREMGDVVRSFAIVR